MGSRVFAPTHRKKTPGRTLDSKKWTLLYDHTWKLYRERFLKINPRCYRCGGEATVVDHLIPHQGDTMLFKKLDNHIPLCQICHNKATGLFDRRHRPGMPVDNKIKWMQMERAMKELTFKIKVLPNYGE